MEWRMNGEEERINTPINGNAGPSDGRSIQIDGDSPAAPYIECLADIRVLAQTVIISDISFVNESFKLFTELTIVPIVPDLTKIRLHLGPSARLPNECGNFEGSVTVNDVDAHYTRLEPFKFISHGGECLSEAMPRLYSSLHKNDAELEIIIPSSVLETARSMMCLKVAINIVVIQPKSGIQFSHCFGRDGQLEKGAHMFTYKSSLQTASREWLPCVDAPDQVCLWRIHITCDVNHTAIASAQLMEVELSPELREKTYHYQQSVPTAACNIGFAVGQFLPFSHPDIAEVTSFALPGLMSLVRHTVSPLDKVMEYLEELLSCRYPYPSYKQVFVDGIADDVTSYSSLTIFSVNVLYHKKIIDVVQDSRQMLALGVAQQFFGCFITSSHWLDYWIGRSLSLFIVSLYVEKIFGTSEALYQVKGILNAVCDYESQWGKVILRPPLQTSMRSNLHCDARHERTCSPLYAEALVNKGHLAMRMLSKRLGHEPFFQVLHKILTVGQQMSERRDRPLSWTHMIISTESFFRTVTNVTGHEIPTFLEQWIYSGGHASFQVQYTFNRKRNMIELEVKQDVGHGNGRLRYVGPLTVVVQELDGSFNHTVQIDGDISRSDLQCHSKGRRQKKKRVPLYTGEEVEVDLTNMDPDSPVLWIRVDPELNLLRNLIIRQPIYQWEYMIKYERDVLAQLQALERLQQFPSAQSKSVLKETITNDNFYYRVRCRAAYSLAAVSNRMTETLSAIPDLITIFMDQFGSKSSPSIPKSNNFVATSQNIQQYFLMQALPQAVSRMRSSGSCLGDVQAFILRLITFNDNSTNRYSDDHYRAAILTALAGTIVQANSNTVSLSTIASPDTMTSEMKRVLQEFTVALNMDTLKPSFGRVVGIAALNGIYTLQRFGHIPSDSKVFWLFAVPKNCLQMRKAALSILVERMSNAKCANSKDDFRRLISMSAKDDDPAIRVYIPILLTATPPFATYNNTDFGMGSNPTNCIQVADDIWTVMNDSEVDTRVRLLMVDVYFTLYGLGVPPIKGGPSIAAGHHRSFNATSNASDWMSLDDVEDSIPRTRVDSFTEDIMS